MLAPELRTLLLRYAALDLFIDQKGEAGDPDAAANHVVVPGQTYDVTSGLIPPPSMKRRARFTVLRKKDFALLSFDRRPPVHSHGNGPRKTFSWNVHRASSLLYYERTGASVPTQS